MLAYVERHHFNSVEKRRFVGWITFDGTREGIPFPKRKLYLVFPPVLHGGFWHIVLVP